jgi:hypothetical protein
MRNTDWMSDRYLEKTRQDALDALNFLQTGGVVSTPEMFWFEGCGESLLARIKKIHGEKLVQAYDEAHNTRWR